MPTYEYLCASCGKRYEKREGFDALAKQKCQFCRKLAAQRVLYAPPVVFKGGGFYKTDSRGKSGETAEAAPATPAAASANGDAAGGDSGSSSSTDGADGKPAAPAKKETAAAKKHTTTTETAAAS